MSTVIGLQPYQGSENYGVLLEDMAITTVETGERYKGHKLYAYPLSHFAFGIYGRTDTDTLIMLREQAAFDRNVKKNYFTPKRLDKEGFSIRRFTGILLFEKLHNYPDYYNLADVTDLEWLSSKFGMVVSHIARQLNQYDDHNYLSELTLKYLQMPWEVFAPTLRSDIRTQNKDFFQLLQYAYFSIEDNVSRGPQFIFLLNDTDEVEMYASTVFSDDTLLVTTRVSNFRLENGDVVLKMLREQFKVPTEILELDYGKTMQLGLNALDEAGKTYEGTKGFDVVKVIPGRMFSYRRLIENLFRTEPKRLGKLLLDIDHGF